jgi:hypothetical protein
MDWRPIKDANTHACCRAALRMAGANQQETTLIDGLTETVTNRLMQLTASQPVGIIPFGDIAANHLTNIRRHRASWQQTWYWTATCDEAAINSEST